MGGINCPPPNLDPVSSRVMDEYVHKLAEYCEPLFDGVASFYRGNAQVESAVMGIGDVDTALTSFERSERQLTEAWQRLDSIAAMRHLISTEQVDFREQSKHLSEAIGAIGHARMEMYGVSSRGLGLQEGIWDRPAVTEYLTEASVHLSEAIAWQTRFAAQTAILAIAA